MCFKKKVDKGHLEYFVANLSWYTIFNANDPPLRTSCSPARVGVHSARLVLQRLLKNVDASSSMVPLGAAYMLPGFVFVWFQQNVFFGATLKIRF